MIEEMSDFFTVENNNLEIAIKLIWENPSQVLFLCTVSGSQIQTS